MNVLKKVWATLTGYSQRPDPNTANSDLRQQTVKDMNNQKQGEQRMEDSMGQGEQKVPNPMVSEQGVEEEEVSTS
jgi:hypothetical protein